MLSGGLELHSGEDFDGVTKPFVLGVNMLVSARNAPGLGWGSENVGDVFANGLDAGLDGGSSFSLALGA